MSKVYLTIDQTPEGRFQLSIGDENGGYRIAGPKFDGRSKTIMRHEVRPQDVSEIGQYLIAVGGAQHPGASSQPADSAGAQTGGSK